MKLTNQPPPVYAPADPDAAYAAFMAQFEALPEDERRQSDPSRYFSEIRGYYITDGGKPADQHAQDLRWAAHEWRRRSLAPPLVVTDQEERWTGDKPCMESKPMREIAIKAHANRTRGRKADKYANLGELYHQGLQYTQIAKECGVSRTAVRNAIERRIESGELQPRVQA